MVPAPGSGDDFDLGPVSVRTPEPGIAGEQWRVERFCERNVSAVVSGQRLAQLPNTSQELSMRITVNDEPCKVI